MQFELVIVVIMTSFVEFRFYETRCTLARFDVVEPNGLTRRHRKAYQHRAHKSTSTLTKDKNATNCVEQYSTVVEL